MQTSISSLRCADNEMRYANWITVKNANALSIIEITHATIIEFLQYLTIIYIYTPLIVMWLGASLAEHQKGWVIRK